MAKKRPIIGVTIGDPAGIGPEVTALALADPAVRRLAELRVIGDTSVLRRYRAFKPDAHCRILDQARIQTSDFSVGKPGAATGRAALAYLNAAVALLKEGSIQALVTAPVCKEAISGLGTPFEGHTEFLAESFGVRRFEMMFACEDMRTIIVTRHIPLSSVSAAVTLEKVLTAVEMADEAMRRFFRRKNPKIAVCGLNPHAGEGGTIGREEITTIIPALERARRKGIVAEGPFAADTLFCPAKKKYDVIIAMYHDQGLTPIKALYFRKVVNLTLGLPFVRTSPAHGTAFDIAGKGKADPASMVEAIELAARLAGR